MYKRYDIRGVFAPTSGVRYPDGDAVTPAVFDNAHNNITHYGDVHNVPMLLDHDETQCVGSVRRVYIVDDWFHMDATLYLHHVDQASIIDRLRNKYGLGLSVGYRILEATTSYDADDGYQGRNVRTVTQAVLDEISIVTTPASKHCLIISAEESTGHHQ